MLDMLCPMPNIEELVELELILLWGMDYFIEDVELEWILSNQLRLYYRMEILLLLIHSKIQIFFGVLKAVDLIWELL